MSSCLFILCFESFLSNKKGLNHLQVEEDKWKLFIWRNPGKVKSQLFPDLLTGSKFLILDSSFEKQENESDKNLNLKMIYLKENQEACNKIQKM